MEDGTLCMLCGFRFEKNHWIFKLESEGSKFQAQSLKVEVYPP